MRDFRQEITSLTELLKDPSTMAGMRFKRKLALVREMENLASLLESYGTIALYKPNPAQQRFLYHPGREKMPRVRLFLGGNRSGKTDIGMVEAYSFMTGERLFDGSKTPIRVPNRGRIVVTSYLDGGQKVIVPKIRRIVPPEMIEYTKQGQNSCLVEVHLKNGSWFDIVSSEQESMKHEGADMDWVWFDEPPPREHFIANWRGLVDRGGFLWMTLTPLTEPWIKDELFDKAMGDEDYYAVVANTRDNIGYGLTEDAIAKFESALTEEEKATRIRGEFLALQGRVYKEYKDAYFPDGHLIKPFRIPEHWPRFVGIDPHDRTPTHILWLAVDEHDDVYVYDELAAGGKAVKDIAEAIKERESMQDEPGYRVIRIMDPNSCAKKNSVEVGLNIQDMFTQNGIYSYPGNNDITAGHKAVRELMRFRQTLRGDRPRVFVFDSCIGFRRAIMNYIYDDRFLKGTNRDYRMPKENKVRERDKHYPDAFRYVAMFNPRYMHARDRRAARADNWLEG